jgi:cyclopropane-fatty-acyl-phospholipid synthase
MRSALYLQQEHPVLASRKYQKLLGQLNRHGIRVMESSEIDSLPKPWDILCQSGHRDQVLQAIAQYKTLGLGNTYIKGLWSCDRLDLLAEKLFELDREGQKNSLLFELPNSVSLVAEELLYRTFNISLMRQYDARQHYDLPPALYEGFLGESMKYTTGDWTGLEQTPENLDLAQRQNLEYWVQELQIQDGDVVLDCGCGWGTLPAYLQDRFDLTYIGITISEVQAQYCRDRFPHQEKFFFYNHSYHDAHGEILAKSGVSQIDRCLFLETLEHGGIRNWPNILKQVRQVISPSGTLGIQTIGADHPSPVCDPYINRYIFPHLSIGSPSELGLALEQDRQFVECKRNNIAHHYPATLQAWADLFQKNWSRIQPEIAKLIDTTPFATTEEWRRHWEFYLLLCCGAFKAGTYPQLYQVTAKPNFFAR